MRYIFVLYRIILTPIWTFVFFAIWVYAIITEQSVTVVTRPFDIDD